MPRTKSTDHAAEAAMNALLGARLYALRRARGMTLDDLASRVGVSYQAYQKYERAEAAVSFPRLAALASALDMTLPELLAFPEGTEAQAAADQDRTYRELFRIHDRLSDRDRGLLLQLARELGRTRKT